MRKKNIISIALSVVFSVVFVAAAVNAATTIGTDIDTGGNLTVTGNASTTLFSAYGPAYFGATATSTFSSAGALTLVSPLGVGSGGTGLTSATAGYALIGNSASALQATSTLFVSSASYVGIGTSTPAYELDVYGSARINNNLDVNWLNINNGLSFFTGGGVEKFELYANNANILDIYNAVSGYATLLDTSLITTSDKTFTFPNWSGNFLVASSTSLTVAANGNVGIGTSTPATQLEVHATTGTSTVSVISEAASTGSRIILEDSDGAGCTEIYALNGTLISATVACPAN